MKRHALVTRLWHWFNLPCLVVLFMSGLNISNAHPRLYWGEWGFAPEDAWLHLPRYPGWATIPGHYSLADARLWHFLFAWPFALGLIAFIVASIANRHFVRDLIPRRDEWRWSSIREEIGSYLRLRFDHPGSKFGSLQKLAYAAVIFILLPLMIVTGLAMSPAMDANWPWLTGIFGGRQSARSVHFLAAWALFAFLLVHLAMVLLSRPLSQLRAMIAGGRA